MALEHLVSYRGMGSVRLECVDECECAPQIIDAHKTSELRNVSVFETHRFPVRATRPLRRGRSRASEPWVCEVLLTLLARTSSGATKFKVRSLEVTSALPLSNASA